MGTPPAALADPHFTGKVAVVTGGASGIGRALATALAARGARLALADVDGGRLEATVRELRDRGFSVRGETVDVANFSAVDAFVAGVFAQEGRLDFMFNNAGIAIGGGVHRYQIEDWQRVVNVNLNGVIHGVQATYARMIAQGSGHIINTASTAGLVPSGRSVVYSTTKHAIVGLSTSLRAQAALHGIKVTVLCPGVVNTDLLTGTAPQGKELVPLTPTENQQMLRALRPISPEIFAGDALRSVRRNDAIYVQGALMRVLWWITRLSPTMGIKLDHVLLRASPLARTLR